MKLQTLINSANLLQFKGLLVGGGGGGGVQFKSIFRKSRDPHQTPRFVTSDNGLHCLYMTHEKASSCIDIVLIFFHILVLLEYWVLTESRIPLKPVLGDVRIVALFISLHEQTHKAESAVF